MKIEKVEKLLKSKAKTENKKRAKMVIEDYDAKSSYCKPIVWQDALGFHYQSKNKIFKDCNGKCTFDPASIAAHSYKHWQFVRLIKGKVVFNWYKYSNTTSGHQWKVIRLLEKLGVKVDLEIDTRESLTQFETVALESLYKDLFKYEVALNRKGIREVKKQEYKKLISKVKSSIKIATKLGATISSANIVNIEYQAIDQENERLKLMKESHVKRSKENQAVKQLVKNNIVFDVSKYSTY